MEPCLPGHRPSGMRAKCVPQEVRQLGGSDWGAEVWRKLEWALKSVRSRQDRPTRWVRSDSPDSREAGQNDLPSKRSLTLTGNQGIINE